MKIVSVNTGRAEPIGDADDRYVSGINKRAENGSVFIGATGLKGDAICDEEFHGGVDQAVYVYGAEDYAWWSEQLGRQITPGMFGDNLTIAALPADMNAGDRLTIGEVLLEATAPRIPCSTLAAQMGDRKFGLRFRRAERPGFYFRVISSGEVAAGASVTLSPSESGGVSMLELFRLSYEVHPPADRLKRALDAPIAARMHDEFARKLASVD